MSVKKSLNSLAFFVKQCINTCISFAKVIIRLPNVSRLPVAPAKSCAILGNGPSLSKSLAAHPGFFKDRPLVCVNGFSMAKEFSELKPEYYVMLDSSFWLQKGDNAAIMKVMDDLKTKTTWPLYLFVPPEAKKSTSFSTLEKQNPNIRIVYFNYTVFKGFKGIGHFFYKRNMAMMQSQNILTACLFLSINMGFKEIYLFGADHTWHEQMHVNDENVLCVKHTHFYSDGEKTTFVPFYKGAHLKEVFNMAEILATMSKVFSGYAAVNDYAKTRNCEIYNASDVSFIDAFKRIKL
ncbi:MAG: hypothetical protein JWP12_1178 [Bacteroidetes bacterium]|nr:hypothetical protein [Bacteroidota bacterium]